MPQAQALFPIGGGLDLVTPGVAVRAGRAIAGLNYEPTVGGYKRIQGFERFDGHPAPSEATYRMLQFDAGAGAITAGQTVTGATSGATGVALANAVVTSGTYVGSNAAGYIGLGAVTGTFQDNENLQVSAVTKCVANGLAVEGLSPDDVTAAAWLATAQANARALIAAVPGTGPVRGVWYFDGEVYALRDKSGENYAGLYKASTSGWTEIPTVTPPSGGGPFDPEDTFVVRFSLESVGTQPTRGQTIVEQGSGASAHVEEVQINETGAGEPTAAMSASAAGQWQELGTQIAITNPSNALTSNNTYATVTLADLESSNYHRLTGFGFNIPSNALVTGVKVEVECKVSTGSINNTRIQGGFLLIDNVGDDSDHLSIGNGIGQPSIPTAEAYVSCGGSTNLWKSGGLTSTEVNDSNFGVDLFYRNLSGGSRTVSIDHVRMTVYFTTEGGTGTLTINQVTGTWDGDTPFDTDSDEGVGTLIDLPGQGGGGDDDPTVITLPLGGRYEFINHNFYGAANLRRMYGVNGVGRAFQFDGTTLTPIITGMTVDTPHRIAVHNQALVLGFPGGSVQISAVGDSLNWDPVLGASEIAIGDEITDFIPNVNGAMAILGANSISMLYGNDSSDYLKQTLSDEAGALPFTAEKMGTPIYMDNRGVRSLSTTQAYGNFRLGTISSQIQPLLDRLKGQGISPIAACRVRAKDQYRLFFDNGYGLTFYLGNRESEILPFNLGKVVRCICSVEDDETNEVIYFGSDDGFVYQLDKGNSFDGEDVEYYLRFAFNHAGSPNQWKKWHRAKLECESAAPATLRVSFAFDYDNSNIHPDVAEIFTIPTSGGQWDVSDWDEFLWDAPVEGEAECYVDGFGKNMSVMVAGSAADEPPHQLKSLTLFYSMRGASR